MTVKALRDEIWEIASMLVTHDCATALKKAAALRRRIKRALRSGHELSWLLYWVDTDLRHAMKWLREGNATLATMNLQCAARTVYVHAIELRR